MRRGKVLTSEISILPKQNIIVKNLQKRIFDFFGIIFSRTERLLVSKSLFCSVLLYK